MIDPVIDEHFRRSLGADYAVLFGGTKKPGAAVKPTPIVVTKRTSPMVVVSQSLLSPTVATVNVTASPIAAVSPITTTMLPTIAVMPTTAAAILAPTCRISTSPSTSAAIVVKVEPQPARQQPPAPAPPSASPHQQPTTVEDTAVGMSVDDHFAKALGGDTWKQLKRAESRHDDALC